MKNNNECYSNTLRVYGHSDIQLIKDLKKEFNTHSLSKAIVDLAKEHKRIKKELAQIQKAITVKYEIKPDQARRLRLGGDRVG